MEQPFAVFDIDGTLVRWQLYHAIADAVLAAAKPEEHQKVIAARSKWKSRTHEESFREYEMELLSVYEAVLQSVDVSAFLQANDKVFEEYKDQIYRYTRDLIHDLKAKGYLIFAISGSNDEVVGKMAQYYGFDDYAGVKYLHKDGHFTGKVTGTWGRKDKILLDLVAKHQATFAGSVGVGDSEGDITMLELVEHPIAFNPSKKLFMHAQEQGWRVVVERKNMVYELGQHDGTYILA